MTTWFEGFGQKVTPVEVEKFTDNSVWIGGRRTGRNADWRAFFPTEREAWDWVQAREEARVASAERQVVYARGMLEKALAARKAAGCC